LVILFAIYTLSDGIVSLAGATIAAREQKRWAALLFEGIAGVVVASITLTWPAITPVVLIFMFSSWAIVTGILELAVFVYLRRYIEGELMLAYLGMWSIISGLVIAAMPISGAHVIALLICAYSLVSGALLVILGLRLRMRRKDAHFDQTLAA